MEHSPETNSPFYGFNGVSYYGGPLVYCYKDDNNQFIKITDGEVVPTDFWLESKIYFEDKSTSEKSNDVTLQSSTGYNVETYYTEYSPYCLDCNDEGTCGVVAATIFFMYYHKYIHSGFANPYFMNSPTAFHDYLLNYYLQGSGDYSSMTKGMNKYINSVNINNFVASVKTGFHSFLSGKIRIKEPVILGLYGDDEVDESWRINHWVLVYGYREFFMNNQSYNIEYIVNDGWGHNQVFITYDTSYMDGVIGLSLDYNE